MKPHAPFVPSHEGAGEVAEVGAGVTHLEEGNRVGVPWLHMACGRCEHCVGERETLRDSQQNTGYSVDGAYAAYVTADADYVGVIPGRTGLGPGFAGPLRRRDGLQGSQGDRGATGSVDRDQRHRRARVHGHAICEAHGP